MCYTHRPFSAERYLTGWLGTVGDISRPCSNTQGTRRAKKRCISGCSCVTLRPPQDHKGDPPGSPPRARRIGRTAPRRGVCDSEAYIRQTSCESGWARTPFAGRARGFGFQGRRLDAESAARVLGTTRGQVFGGVPNRVSQVFPVGLSHERQSASSLRVST